MTMGAKSKDRIVPAGEFKAKCLAILDEVERTGRSFVVTKRGRRIARVVPFATGRRSLLGSVLHEEDLLSPVDAAWNANT